jgi:hypothetical protein
MNRYKKYLLYPIIAITTYALLSDFCHKKTKGFQLNKMQNSTDIDSFFSEDEADVATILEQPFFYLKKGRFCFVFVSQDKKYVIKFLQMNKLFAPFWVASPIMQWLHPSLCKNIQEKALQQKTTNLTSYKLAFTKLSQQSGTLSLHLAKTKHLAKTITLYDALGIRHQIQADETAFILQKKAESFSTHVEKLIQQGEKNEVKKLLSQFASLLLDRAKIGVADKDLSPRYNLGILEGNLLPFDLDSLRQIAIPKSFEDYKNHMMQDAKKMARWISHFSEEYSLFLEEEIAKLAMQSSISS